MSSPVIRIDGAKVRNALSKFAAGLQPARRRQLMQTIGLGQLQSIYKTFAEEGSPAGTWPKLSSVSLSWNKYSAGHKLLIGRGLLRNSIRVRVVSENKVVIGTGMRYAGVHQFGFSGEQKVKGYSYSRRVKSRDQFATFAITNKKGRKQNVRRRTMSGVVSVTVRPFARKLSIPARPYLVFRPEDPERHQNEVNLWARQQASDAGLAVS